MMSLIPAQKSDYILYKVWDEIIHPFPNFNSAAIAVFENGYIILSHTLLCRSLFIHAGI